MYYVYRITNIIQEKHYYGVRKSDNPKVDLGKKYFSSSSDRDFIQEQKTNPERYRYKIVRRDMNKLEAYGLECLLHKKFNVAFNERFYNKANSTSLYFNSDNTGFVPCVDNVTKVSKLVTIEDYHSHDKYVHPTKGTVVAVVDGVNTRVSTEDYYSLKLKTPCTGVKRESSHLKGKVPVRNLTTGEVLSVDVDEFNERDDLVHVTSGTAVAICLETGESKRIAPEEYVKGKYRYVNEGIKQTEHSNKKRSETLKSKDRSRWMNPRVQCDSKRLESYNKADYFYNIWIDHNKPGIHKLRKITGDYIIEKIHFSFINGWVPMEDEKWIKYFRNDING